MFNSEPRLPLGTWKLGAYETPSSEYNLLEVLGQCYRPVSDTDTQVKPPRKHGWATQLLALFLVL